MTASKALKTLTALAAAHGATLDESEGRRILVNVDAPTGKVWKANGCHLIAVTLWYHKLEQAWNDDSIKDAREQIAMGLRECDVKDCDVCNDY